MSCPFAPRCPGDAESRSFAHGLGTQGKIKIICKAIAHEHLPKTDFLQKKNGMSASDFRKKCQMIGNDDGNLRKCTIVLFLRMW